MLFNGVGPFGNVVEPKSAKKSQFGRDFGALRSPTASWHGGIQKALACCHSQTI